MVYQQVTVLAVLVSAIAGMALGALWYSPLLFGKAWMRLSGMTQKQLAAAKKQGMAAAYGVTFLGMLVMAFVLAMLLAATGAETVADGALLAFWLWLGFLATTMIGSVLWEKKPFTLYLLNIAHYLVVLVVMTGILIWFG